MIDGPDVSSHQHDNGASIDYAAVRGYGCEFAYVKASEGLSYTNPFFVADYRGFRSVGITVGAYHYCRPGTSPQSQAQRFASIVTPLQTRADLRLCADFEETDGRSPSYVHGWLHAFRAALSAAGQRMILYTYPAFWQTNGSPSCAECAGDPLWFASYPRTSPGPTATPPAPPRPWSSVAIWQTDGTRKAIPGIVGGSDYSRFVSARLSDLTVGSVAPPTPPPYQEDDMADPMIVPQQGSSAIWLVAADLSTRVHLATADDVRALRDGRGYAVVNLSTAQLATIPEVKAS